MIGLMIVLQGAEAGRVEPVAEAGAAWIPLNALQLGRNGTRLDLPDEAGQGRLFPTWRLQLDLAVGARSRSRFSLTWQPLELSTRAVAERDWVVNDVTFPTGTPMEVRFGFSFFRASYQYDVLPSEAWTLGLGANLQLRTSSLEFFRADGSEAVSQQEFGPVPSVLVRLRRDFDAAWLEAELDALPTPVGGFYGFYELDLRLGLVDERGFEPYLLLRGLGGGYRGPTPGSGFSDSELLLIVLGVGAAIR